VSDVRIGPSVTTVTFDRAGERGKLTVDYADAAGAAERSLTNGSGGSLLRLALLPAIAGLVVRVLAFAGRLDRP
jgi:hypothetical protein